MSNILPVEFWAGIFPTEQETFSVQDRSMMMTDDTDDLLAMYNQLLPILGINFDEEVLSQGR